MAGTKKVQPKKATAKKAAPKQRAATKSTRESLSKKGGGGRPNLVSDPIFTIQI